VQASYGVSQIFNNLAGIFSLQTLFTEAKSQFITTIRQLASLTA
jgi:hypothetical protein